MKKILIATAAAAALLLAGPVGASNNFGLSVVVSSASGAHLGRADWVGQCSQVKRLIRQNELLLFSGVSVDLAAYADKNAPVVLGTGDKNPSIVVPAHCIR